MAKIGNKLFDIIRNLKPDAVPRSPRPGENLDDLSHEDLNENINIEESESNEDASNDPKLKKEKKKSKFKFFKPNSYNDDKSTNKERDYKRSSSNSNVNTQATGNVINIVNSPDFHWGNNYVYHLGTHNITTPEHKPCDAEEEDVSECMMNLINPLLDAKIKPEHDYLDYIAKNLGENWKRFFRSLGYTKGRIETVVMEQEKRGISEARYKLLLDWVRNDDDGTLGRMATLLWQAREKQIVQQLALIYRDNSK